MDCSFSDMAADASCGSASLPTRLPNGSPSKSRRLSVGRARLNTSFVIATASTARHSFGAFARWAFATDRQRRDRSYAQYYDGARTRWPRTLPYPDRPCSRRDFSPANPRRTASPLRPDLINDRDKSPLEQIQEFPHPAFIARFGPSGQADEICDSDNRRAATYVDKICKGAKPADLPIEQPIGIEFIINGKAAKALGLEIPRPTPARRRGNRVIGLLACVLINRERDLTMSGIRRFADSNRTSPEVRKVPEADECSAAACVRTS